MAARLWLLTVVLVGCAHRAVPPSLPPEASSGLNLDVPFWPQSQYQCGPASLAALLASSGVAVVPDDLVPLVYLPARQGSLQPEMLAAPRAFERIGYRLPGTREAIIAELNDARPVLVLLNLGLRWWPRWHYAVVTGIDGPDRTFVMHSGMTPDRRIDQQRFMQQWQRADHWAMVVTTPSELPASAALPDLLDILASLETTRPDLASQAYHATLVRWPDAAGAAFGWGVSALASGQPRIAATAFQQTLALRPGAPAAINNLAIALARNGQTASAIQLLRDRLASLAANDPWRSTLDQTLDELIPEPR